MSANVYQCVRCGRAPLEKLRTAFRCDRCRTIFPVLFDVPLFFPKWKCEPSGYRLLRETAVHICKRIGVEMDSISHFMLQQIYSYDFEVSERKLAAITSRFLATSGEAHDESQCFDQCGIRLFRVDREGRAYGFSSDIHSMQVCQLAARSAQKEHQFVAADTTPFNLTLLNNAA